MDRDAIRREMKTHRDRLTELHQMLGDYTSPVIKDGSARVSVGITAVENAELIALARRCNTSVSALGQVAIRQLLIQARSGALPMVTPSRMETAETVTCLGNPIPNYPA